MSLRTLERIVHALDAELDLTVRWHGGQLERLLDEGHAALTELAARSLAAAGWQLAIEVTYEVGRASGSIDILAFRSNERALVVCEVKTEILGSESMLRKHDEKTRLATRIAADRFGWDAATVSRLLILPAASSSWRALEKRAEIFERSYPLRGRAVARWLRAPTGAVSGAWTISDTKPAGTKSELSGRRRVRAVPRQAA